MANDLSGQVWSLDTVVGVVTTSPVYIHSINVRFTTAGAGSLQILTNISGQDSSNGKPLLDAATFTTDTTNADQCSQTFTFADQPFSGLKKTLSVNVATIWIVTCSPK